MTIVILVVLCIVCMSSIRMWVTFRDTRAKKTVFIIALFIKLITNRITSVCWTGTRD